MTNKYLEKIAESNSTNWQPYAGAAGALALGAAGGLLGRRFGQAASKKALSLVDSKAGAAAATKFDHQIDAAKVLADRADKAHDIARRGLDKLPVSGRRFEALDEVGQHLADAERYAASGNQMGAAFSRSKAALAKKRVDALTQEYDKAVGGIKGLHDTSSLAYASMNKLKASKNDYVTSYGSDLTARAMKMPTRYIGAGGFAGALSGGAGGYYAAGQG